MCNTPYAILTNPYLEYCNIAWASNRTTQLEQLVTMQKKAPQMIIVSDCFAYV